MYVKTDTAMNQQPRDPNAPPTPPVNWPTVLFIGGTSLGAALWPAYAWFYGVTLGQIALALFGFVSTAMAITVGYHRLVAHRTYKARPWVKALLLLVGSAAWQGSALEWATEHVQHHSHIDTERDPYNRQRGFWYAHMGWLIRKRELDRTLVPAWLAEDRLVVLQDRYYSLLAITTSLLIPLALCGVGGLLLIGAVRIVAVHHVTWFINSWAHTGSNRPYNSKVSAVDNWFLAFMTFGEGWHNYHHAFPADYRNGIGIWAWDPSKWLIWSLSTIGATYDLKQMSPAVVWRKRVDTALAYEGSIESKRRLLSETRRSLEARARKTHERLLAAAKKAADRDNAELAKLVGRFHAIEFPEISPPDLAELKERFGEAADRWRDARDSRRLKRARRVQEALDHLAAYRTLLERLAAQNEAASA
jgi:stearoyl-CoA desaturase (delta-9 desaturase)